MKRAKKGFTLIEVICVLVIIAIVAVIAVPSISKYIDNSKINNCKSTMNNFINDLEYKIVSKRYYDVDELNGELVKYVDANADSLNSDPQVDSPDGKFKSLTENITEATGVCPNGGHYSIKWIITPGGEENPNTARVKLESCVCDCMKDAEKNVQLNSAHEFTAALITRSDYLKSSATEDENYREEIQKIVDYINGRLNDNNDINDPSRIDDIIRDYEELHKDDPVKYVIRGATVKENRPGSGNDNWVEWISVSLQTDYPADGKDVYKFITYYPERKDGSSTPGTGNVFQSGDADGKLVIREIETESGKDPDSKDWPPVEGTYGSYYYLQGLDYDNNKSYQIDDVNKNIPFIQKDTNWYVQKTNSTAGINSIISVAEGDKADYPLISNDWLIDGNSLNIINEDALNVYINPNVSNADFRDIFLVQPQYNNGSKTEFGHLKASDLTKDNPNDYFISNGYILVSSPDAVKDKDGNIINWAGIWAEEYDADGNKIENSERETLKQLLREEDQLVSDVFKAVSTGDYKNGEEGNKYNEITVAYQEYYKSNDKVEAYTNFGTIRIYQPANPSEDAVIKSVVNGTETAIGYISVKDVADSYNINVKNTSSDGKFSTDDLEITKKVTYTVKDMNDNVKCKETETVILKAGVDYYIATSPVADKDEYKNVTNASIKDINNGKLTDPDQAYYFYLPGLDNPIGKIASGEADSNTLKWEYNKDDNDKVFNINRIRAWVDCPIQITQFDSDTQLPEKVMDYSVINKEYPHRTGSNSEGWYITTSETAGFLGKTKEEALVNTINDVETTAVIMLYKKDGEKAENIKMFDVKTEISSLNEKHTVKKVDKAHSWLLDFLRQIGSLSASIVNRIIDFFGGDFGVYMGGNDLALGLDVSANYTIKVIDANNSSDYSLIRMNPKILNWDDAESYNYSYKDSRGRTHNETGKKINYRRFFVYDSKVNSLTLNQEEEFLSRLTYSFDDYLYVYYADDYNNDSGTKKDKDTAYTFKSYVTFKFKYYDVPDFVYWEPNQLSGELFIEGYLGDSYNIEIPSTFTGKWYDRAPETTNVYTAVDYYRNGKKETIYYTPVESYDFEKVRVRVGKGSLLDNQPFFFANENVQNNIQTIKVSEGIKEIDNYAFSGLKLDSISLPSSLEKIDEGAFEGVVLRNLPNGEFIIPESVTTINQNAFKDFSVNGTLRINGVTTARDWVSPLRYVNNVIQDNVFTNATFKNLVFGPKVNKINDGAFNFESNFFNNEELDESENESRQRPESLQLGSVTNIGANAFQGWTTAKNGELIIPESVTKIGAKAFENYASDTEDTSDYPSLKVMGVTSDSTLDGAVFEGSHFNNVTIGGKVSSIKKSSFSNYSKFTGTLRIENSVSSIGESAFEGCTGFSGSLILPRNQQFKTIYSKAFMGCSGFTGDLDIPSSVTTIEDQAFEGCSGLNGTLNLGNRISSIKGSAFKDCSGFTGNLVIPESVTSMGTFAFERYAADANGVDNYPSLTVYGGSNGTILSSGIFINSHFKNVTIGGNVKKIDGLAFRNAPLKNEMPYDEFKGELKIQDSVTTIGKAAFENCTGFDSLVFSDDSELVSIGDAAFSRCWFKGSLDIPSKVTSIGSRAFNDCVGFDGNLSFSDNSELLSIGDAAFSKCGFIGNLVIPSTVTTIGSEAFKECTGFDGTLKLNEGLKKIGAYAFDGCTHFVGGLTIPSGITGTTETDIESIGNYAFRKFASDVEEQNIGELKIYSGTLSNGKRLDGKRFTGAKFKGVTIGGIVETIDGHAFHHGLTSDETIGDFSGFSGDLVIDNGVNTIKENAFMNDTGMNSVEIPGSVTSIGNSAFEGFGSGEGSLKVYGCSRTVDTEDGGKKRILGNGTEDNCIFNKAKFKDVTIGGNVDRIDEYFMYTNPGNLEKNNHLNIKGSLKIEPLVQEIGKNAFNGDKGFDSVYIPETVVSIGEKAFANSGSGKKFDPETEPDRVGLTIYGCSQIVDGSHVLGNSNDELFNNAKYNNVTIGGNVEVIANDLMSSGKSDFDHTKLTGTLKIESPVRSIGIKSFYGDTGFDSVIIPDTVTVIGDSAFDYSGSGNGSLEIYGYSWTDENGAKVLGHGRINSTIFNHGKYRNVTIGGSVEVIGYRFMKTEPNMKIAGTTDQLAYDYSGITGDLIIGGNVKMIDEEAFNETGIDGKLIFGDKIEADGEITFIDTGNLNTIKHSAFENLYYAKGGLTIPDTVTSIGTQAFEKFSSMSDELGPLVIKGYSSVDEASGLNTIDADRFEDAMFTGVTIGGKVQKIADGFMSNNRYSTDGAHYDNITGDLKIEGSVKVIGNEAFNYFESDDSKNRGKLILEEGIESIGEKAFANTRFFGKVDVSERNFTIPSTVTFMGTGAFENFCSNFGTKPSLTILGGNKQSDGEIILVSNLFGGAGFNNVTIGGNVTNISGLAFYDAEDENKYSGITGILTILPKTVGYNGTNYIPLQPKNDKGTVIGGGMSFRKHEDGGRFAPFLGVKFSGAVFPEGLYEIFVKNQWDLFDTWDGRGDGRNFKFTAVG